MRWGRARARRLDRLRTRARVALVVGALVLLAAVHVVFPYGRAWAQSTALFGEVVLRLPVRPITWITATPRTVDVTWPDGGRGLLTRPGAGARHAAFVLELGAHPAPPSDPRVVRLTDTLARLGFAVLLTQSAELDADRVLPDEVPRLVGAFDALRAQPDVDPARVGFIGLSAGGALAITAASQPAIASHVWCVLAIGPFSDAGRLVAETAAHAYRTPDGARVAWEPAAITRDVVRATLLAALPSAERAAVAAGSPSTPEGRSIASLLQPRHLTLDQALSLVRQLPPDAQAMLRAVSPIAHVDGLRAPLYLVHDRHDTFVPWPQSARLVQQHPPAAFELTDLFRHVDPHPTSLVPLVRGGWRLERIFIRILVSARPPGAPAGP